MLFRERDDVTDARVSACLLSVGRRSSDRLYLVLQNMAFAQLVRGYQGTSSVYAATILNKVSCRPLCPRAHDHAREAMRTDMRTASRPRSTWSCVGCGVCGAQVWDKLGWSDDARLQYLGPLMGTHAHEQSSILQQLLADMDSAAGQEAVGKV